MLSFIFNFDHARKYLSLPRREKQWHATVAIACALSVAGSFSALVYIYDGRANPRRFYKSGAVEALSPRTQVLALGSSHIMMGLWPERYSVEMINLTAGALNLSCVEALLKRHISRVPNLQTAIIEVEDAPLIVDTVTSRSGDLRDLLHLGLSPFDIPVLAPDQKHKAVFDALAYPLINLPRATPHGWAQNQMQSYAVRQRPRAEQKKAQIGLNLMESIQPFPGFIATTLTIQKGYDPRPLMNTINTPHPHAQQVIKLNTQALVRSVRMLRERGVRVLLLRLPKTSSYWKLRSSYLKKSYAKLDSTLLREFGRDPGVSRLDLTRSAAFSDRDFFDVNHLNIYGAIKVARHLDPHLRKLTRPRPRKVSFLPAAA